MSAAAIRSASLRRRLRVLRNMLVKPWFCSRSLILLQGGLGFASFPAPGSGPASESEIVFAGANPNLPDATFIT